MSDFIIKKLVFAALVLLPFFAFSQTITLSADSEIVQTDALFGFVLTAEGSFDSIEEPDFANFTVENRSQSQSNSITIINGKFEKKSSITYSYALRANKAGVFEIGPASLKVKGKTIKSNKVTITVTGQGGGSAQANSNSAQNAPRNEAKPDDATNENYYEKRANSLMSPLSEWEKKTPDYFIRTVINPANDLYAGEPLNVSYYLFVKPNSISDVNFYKLPVFENCWKDEKAETRLNFKRISIDGKVYDYAPIKTYILIPDGTTDTIEGTQMIMDVITGSFFSTRKATISSVGVKVPLKPMPEKEMHKNGVFGDFAVSVDKKNLTLDKDNMLETLTFSIRGCGNFQDAEIALESNPNLKIFSPEITSSVSVTPKGYCGTKTYKFMVKGLKKGETSIKVKAFEFFSRENGWRDPGLSEIRVNVKETSGAEDVREEEREAVSFELLKELPANVKKYEISPLTEKTWFRIFIVIPFLMVFVSFFIWVMKNISAKHAASNGAKMGKWREKINKSNDCTELLNNFYDALEELYNIRLKGERINAMKQKYNGKIDEITDFIRKIEQLSYSGTSGIDISSLKDEAVKLLDPRGLKK
ncbi:BatD family protein [bacterium]|nr:BatD family protein [bacterium]